DGCITLPFVGVCHLEDMTRDQAADYMADRLGKYYRNPDLNIIVKEYNNNRIFVLGEVRWPGEYNFKGRPMLLGALARAQGLTRDADMRACNIVRGKGILITVDLYDLIQRGNRELNIPLQPDDTVFVGRNAEDMFFILGEVGRPGAYARSRNVDIVRAIAMAGGVTEDAADTKVQLLKRSGSAAGKVMEIDMHSAIDGDLTEAGTAIGNNDIIFVPSKNIARFNYLLRQITPSLSVLLMSNSVADIFDPE
ncbi:MAG: SLBB domain-containing protein, partial [Kiritimatiellales bacterium]|nr:SLBB domain-containing protein [Kiritimatiellales bacterium]